MKKHWQDWGNLLLGLWIFISPWVLQHPMVTGVEAIADATTVASLWVPGLNASTLLIWNAVIAGALVVVLAGWRIAPPSEGPAKHA